MGSSLGALRPQLRPLGLRLGPLGPGLGALGPRSGHAQINLFNQLLIWFITLVSILYKFALGLGHKLQVPRHWAKQVAMVGGSETPPNRLTNLLILTTFDPLATPLSDTPPHQPPLHMRTCLVYPTGPKKLLNDNIFALEKNCFLKARFSYCLWIVKVLSHFSHLIFDMLFSKPHRF